MALDLSRYPRSRQRSLSVLERRWRKFRTFKRGWYSFLILLGAYVMTLGNAFLISNQALIVRWKGRTYFPAAMSLLPGKWNRAYQGKDLGQRIIGEAQYRDLKRQFAEEGQGNWVVMPPYPYGPNESLLTDPDLEGNPPHRPDRRHWLGTDDRARDVFARLVYGYRISITFALGVSFLSYAFGVAVGACFGFFGGRVDIYGQRLVEIWSALPFLYTVIIVSSIIKPNMWLLMALLALFGWIGISFYIRGEFYREKAKDYVAAAIAQGEASPAIMFGQILPNSLTPIISYLPFEIVGSITALVALDFLGFGVPPPTPSWGELVNQGLGNINKWHLVMSPLGALFSTLLLVVFVGEAVREAFDPKVFSRLR